MIEKQFKYSKRELKKAIAAYPRDSERRLLMAAYHRSRGNLRGEARELYKAKQCSRGIDPSFSYESYLAPYELAVTLYVSGEVVKISDGPYDYWADPAELQAYLERVPCDCYKANHMPLQEEGVPLSVLQVLADNGEVPGIYFELPETWHKESPQDYLKLLEGDSWLVLQQGEKPIFYPSDENVFDAGRLRKVSRVLEEERGQIK